MSRSQLERQRARGGVQENFLKISFQFYADHPKYCLSEWPKETLRPALRELKSLCLKHPSELVPTTGNQQAFHPVFWPSSNEPKGFQIAELENEDVFSVGLRSLNHNAARIFGIFLTDTFYIVWFDFNHDVVR